MNINRDNYESYFIDYLDGRMNASQEKVLMYFLEFNPDLKKELAGIENNGLEPEEVSFEMKSTLRKPQTVPDRKLILDNFEDYCISSLEHQLSEQEEALVQSVIGKDPDKKHVYMLYQSTRIMADHRIIYPFKNRIRKMHIRLPRIRIIFYYAAAIAIVLLALSLFLRNPGDNPEINIVQDHHAGEIHSLPGDVAAQNTTESVTTKEIDVTKPPETMSGINRGSDKEKFLSESKQKIVKRETLKLAPVEPIIAEKLDHQGIKDMSLSMQKNAPDETSIQTINPGGEQKFSIWALADAGIHKINEVSEEGYSFDRKTDDQGKIRRFTIETPLFGFSAPVRNTDEHR